MSEEFSSVCILRACKLDQFGRSNYTVGISLTHVIPVMHSKTHNLPSNRHKHKTNKHRPWPVSSPTNQNRKALPVLARKNKNRARFVSGSPAPGIARSAPTWSSCPTTEGAQRGAPPPPSDRHGERPASLGPLSLSLSLSRVEGFGGTVGTYKSGRPHVLM